MSTTTPTPDKTLSLLEKIQKEIVLVLGAATTISEAVLASVPAGTVTTALQIALPAIAFLAAHAKTISLTKVEQLLGKIKSI